MVWHSGLIENNLLTDHSLIDWIMQNKKNESRSKSREIGSFWKSYSQDKCAHKQFYKTKIIWLNFIAGPEIG